MSNDGRTGRPREEGFDRHEEEGRPPGGEASRGPPAPGDEAPSEPRPPPRQRQRPSERFEARLRHAVAEDAGDGPPRAGPAPPAPRSEVARESFEARLLRKATGEYEDEPPPAGTPRSATSTGDRCDRSGEEVARESFEARLARKASSGGDGDGPPARPMTAAPPPGGESGRSRESIARERFEARLRRKTEESAPTPADLARPEPGPGVAGDGTDSDGGGSWAESVVEEDNEQVSLLRTEVPPSCSRSLSGCLLEALGHLRQLENEHNGEAVPASHPSIAGILATMASWNSGEEPTLGVGRVQPAALPIEIVRTSAYSGEGDRSREPSPRTPDAERAGAEEGSPAIAPDATASADRSPPPREASADVLGPWSPSAAPLADVTTQRAYDPSVRRISQSCNDMPAPSQDLLSAEVVNRLSHSATPQAANHSTGHSLSHSTWRDAFNTSVWRHSHATGSVYAVRATLVEQSRMGEVYEAQPMGFWDRRGKKVAWVTCLLTSLLAVLLSLTLTGVIGGRGADVAAGGAAQPTAAPTFDPRPTLEVVQGRGHVLCGLDYKLIEMTEAKGTKFGLKFKMALCRAVAAVVLGDPKAYKPVPVTAINRFERLHDRSIDLLQYGDTHTIEREISEMTTGTGFTFSSPYNYDGLVFIGNSNFVACAEKQKRFNECSALVVCTSKYQTHHEFIKNAFPATFFKLGTSRAEVYEMLINGTCNVATDDESLLNDGTFLDQIKGRQYVVGTELMTKEPLAMVTRKDDRVWSDVVEWVLQALIYGEEQGLTRDPSLCKNDSHLTSGSAVDLDFMNAVHCVGNYGDIFVDGSPNDRGRSQINNGTGMLYATPLGDLDHDYTLSSSLGSSVLQKIMDEWTFKCGVVVPDGFRGDILESDKLVGMGVEFCRVLAAALFTGDTEQVRFVILPETGNSPYAALANGTVDVLVGGRIQRKYDFKFYSSFDGLDFSDPYYYGIEPANADVSFYSIATREEDGLFSSFVNMIVVATIYAEEKGISKEEHGDMPLVNLFGPRLYWALRDAIAYGGNYDDIYYKHFGGADSGDFDNIEEYEIARGRNALNEGGPMMLSFPHLP